MISFAESTAHQLHWGSKREEREGGGGEGRREEREGEGRGEGKKGRREGREEWRRGDKPRFVTHHIVLSFHEATHCKAQQSIVTYTYVF